MLALCAAVAYCRVADVRAEVYRIAVLAPLSGDAASLGGYIRHAVELARDSLSHEEQEGIEVLYADDRMQPVQAVTAFKQLVSAKKINAALVVGSGVGHAVAPLAERDGVIMIAIGASDRSLTSGKTYVFTHWVSPQVEAVAMAGEIERRGYQRIAMISHEQQGVEAFNRALLGELKLRGLDRHVVLQSSVAMDTMDFGAFLTKARASRIDGLYAALFSGALSTFARKAREMGISAEIFGAEVFEDQHEVQSSNRALIGAWYVNADAADGEFVRRYQDRFHEYPGWGSANAYDSFMLVAAAVKKYGKNNSEIAEFLRAVKNYSGACGEYSASGDNGYGLPAAVKVVTASGFEKLRNLRN